jgi:hypothetical protein
MWAAKNARDNSVVKIRDGFDDDLNNNDDEKRHLWMKFAREIITLILKKEPRLK